MTDDTTTDEAPPKEKESEPDPKKEATQALLEELREVFNQNFPEYLNETHFEIKHNENKGPWEISFSQVEGEKSKEEEINIEVNASRGNLKSSNNVIFKVSATQDGKGIRFGFREAGKRGAKSFEVGRLLGSQNDGWSIGTSKIKLKYSIDFNKKEDVLGVWFSGSSNIESLKKRKGKNSSVLQVPIDIYSKEYGFEKRKLGPQEYWPELSGEGLNVGVPEINITKEGGQEGFNIKVEDETESNSSWMRVGLSCLVYWILCNVYGNGAFRENGKSPAGFPSLEMYKAKRPVNLEPASILNGLRDKGLYFPWHVIESACSALNAGKNVILTGPPGCGKSKLASFLAESATGQDPRMTTASPAWSTGDLIGRYMPAREGQGLVFREGVFLRAIGETDERSSWLVIDEFNRADIDSCFGELFSVLAGDTVELPFEKEEEYDEETEEGETEGVHPVRIVPEGDDDETNSDPSETNADYADYRVPDKFRLIGTMNDADRSGLNNLSFALMRRFAIIPVGSPDTSQVCNIIEDKIKKTEQDLQLESYAWNLRERGRGEPELCKLGAVKKEDESDSEDESDDNGPNNEDGSIEEELKFLFAASDEKPDQRFKNLVSEGVVGVSVIGDVIRLVGEGIRGQKNKPKKNRVKDKVETNRKPKRWAENLTLSYLALATVLQIFPQLDALGMGNDEERNKLSQAVLHIFEAFHLDEYYDSKKKLLMLRVRKEGDDYVLESEKTIAEFLFRNLKTQFPRQAESWKDDLRQYLPKDENGNA